jgi:hypothetical protein
LRRGLIGLGFLVVVLGVLVGVGLLHAAHLEHRVSGITAAIQAAQLDAENGRLAEAQAQLSDAEVSLTKVNSVLYDSPDFKLLAYVPVARQNIAAVRATVGLGLGLIGGAEGILQAAAPLEGSSGHLDISLRGGQVPVDTLRSVTAAVGDVVATLPTSPSADNSPLVLGRVTSLEDRMLREAVAKRAELTSVENTLQLLEEATGLDGNRRFLVAVANEAEMRGTGGMILSYAVLTASGGRIRLTALGPIDDLALDHPAPARFPADFERTYGALEPNEQWRNANIMSDFTVVAPVLESMYTAKTGLPVNGVIQVDSTGLGAILTGTGPLQVDGVGLVSSADVVPLTLNQLYVRYPDRTVRQGYLQDVAQSVFTALTTGDIPSLRPLGAALAAAGAGRHLQIYDNTPAIESTVRLLGLSGALPPPTAEFAQMVVENFGGDKMDYYLHSALDLSGALPGGALGHLTATITLTNTAPPGQKPAYVFGPGTDTHDPPGVYRGLVTLYLPAYSFLRESQMSSDATEPILGTQNGVTTISFTVAIPAGGVSRDTVDIQAPPRPAGPLDFEVVPTARVLPTAVSLHIAA